MAASYGVTAADVAATANGMSFSATSRPTSTQVAAWIVQANARVSAAIRSAGADPDTVVLDSAGEAYQLAVQYVTYDASYRALAAQERRESDLARTYRLEARDILEQIRTLAPALGDQRTVDTDSPGLVYADYIGAADQTPTADATFWANPTGQI